MLASGYVTIEGGTAMAERDNSDVYVGRDYGRHDFVIGAAEVEQYSGAVDDHNPIYAGPSPFGGPVAVPVVQQGMHPRGGRLQIEP